MTRRLRRWVPGLLGAGVLAAACAGGNGPAAVPAGARGITIETPDGSRLAGVEMGRGETGVVLVHGATTRKELWYPLLRRLAAAGFVGLAYDSRGVGESTGPEGVDRTGDVEAAMNRLRRAGARRIVLSGSSAGAGTVLNVASTQRVAGVITFSALDATATLTEPGLFVASEGDGDTAAVARDLARSSGGAALVVDGSIHGADLLRDHPEALRRVLRFVRDVSEQGGGGT